MTLFTREVELDAMRLSTYPAYSYPHKHTYPTYSKKLADNRCKYGKRR